MKTKITFLSMLLACCLTSYAQAGSPFNGPHTVPCVIQAEDFDEGGQGVAYHDEDTGYRLVLTSDENGNYKIYVDGILRHTYDHPDKIKDFFWIFTDNDGECGELDCSGLAFWNRTLTAEEVAALGEIEKAPYTGTPYEGVIPNIPEDIIEAEFFNAGS